MADILQLRRDTAANFTAANPILAQGEPALEIDTKKEKIGDGTTAWNDLAYKNLGADSAVDTTNFDGILSSDDDTVQKALETIDDYVPAGGGDMLAATYDPANKEEQVLTIGDKTVANGVASLDGSGKVPAAQLPSYVDDTIEGYLDSGTFYEEVGLVTPITGETGKVYIDLTGGANKSYRWTGSVYARIDDVSASDVEALYNSQVDVVLQAEAEAGTSTTVRRWTAERVKQAIYALAVKLSDFLEEKLNGTADEALTVTGATNVDLSAAAHRNIKLTGNATLTFTNAPASGKTITRTYKIYSDTTETLGIANSTAEYGEYVADGTENLVTVMASNTGTEGLDIHVFFSTPS